MPSPLGLDTALPRRSPIHGFRGRDLAGAGLTRSVSRATGDGGGAAGAIRLLKQRDGDWPWKCYLAEI